MRIKFHGRTPHPGAVKIGMETDSLAESLVFDLPTITNEQTAQLVILLPDGAPEALHIDLTGNYVILPASVTAAPGRARAWVEILGTDHVVWNSEVFFLDIGDLPNVEAAVERQYPTLLQEALDSGEASRIYKEYAESAAAFAVAGSVLVEMHMDGETLVVNKLNPREEGAAAIARANGWDVTDEEFAEFVDEIEDRDSVADAMEKADAAKEAVEAFLGEVDQEDPPTYEGLTDRLDALEEWKAETDNDIEEIQANLNTASTNIASAQTAAETAQAAAEAAAASAQSAATGATHSSSVSVSVPASAWGSTAPYETTDISVAGVTADNTILVGSGGDISDQAQDAIALGGISCSYQGAGVIRLKAYGEKPTVAIPINVLIVNNGVSA